MAESETPSASINLLCAQEALERKRDEIQNQATNFDLPVQFDNQNWVNKSRARWFGFDPVAGEYFTDPIKLGVEVQCPFTASGF